MASCPFASLRFGLHGGALRRASALALTLTLGAAVETAHAQTAMQPPPLGPVPRQAVRRLGGFQSAMSAGDVALALRNWVPDAQVNDIDQTSGDTALTWALGTNTPRVVQRFFVHRLLEHRAHPNAPDHHGWTPMSRAVGAGDAVAVRMLLARGVSASATWGDDEPMSVLFEVCSITGETDYARELPLRSDVLAVLHAAGAPFDTHFGGAGSRYPAQGPIDRCNSTEFAPLARRFFAGGARHFVARFLPQNASYGPSDPASLTAWLAARTRAVSTVDHLRFFEAAGRGDARAATAALPTREAVNSVDGATGATPLVWVASLARITPSLRAQLFEALVQRGADINAQDLDGQTALHAAVETGWTAGVRLLLARGARTDVPDNAGMHAMHNLCMVRFVSPNDFGGSEAVAIAQALVAARADVNALGGVEPGYRRTPADGCTNDNVIDRSGVRAVLGPAGAQLLRPMGLAVGALPRMAPERDAAP